MAGHDRVSLSANDSTTACLSTLSIWGGPQHPPPRTQAGNCPCSDLLSDVGTRVPREPHGTDVGLGCRGELWELLSTPVPPPWPPGASRDPRVPAMPAGAAPPYGRQVAPWPRGEEAPAPPPPPALGLGSAAGGAGGTRLPSTPRPVRAEAGVPSLLLPRRAAPCGSHLEVFP